MSGNGPIQIGDVIEVWGGEVKSSDELMAEAAQEEAVRTSLPPETVISTAEVKQKLTRGGVSSGHVDEFCRVFAIRLPDEITPLGYLMAYELLIADMERATGREITGIGAPIQTYIAGLGIGGVFRMLRSKIAQHCLPEAFAQEVANEWKGVLEDIEKAGA